MEVKRVLMYVGVCVVSMILVLKTLKFFQLFFLLLNKAKIVSNFAIVLRAIILHMTF